MRSSGFFSACPPAQGLALIFASWGSGGEVGVDGGEFIFFLGVGEEGNGFRCALRASELAREFWGEQ